MTETPTLPNPSTGAAPIEGLTPTDILLNLIITLLAPMFLIASGGDISFARSAALQTLDAYCGRSEEDLISIVQIIAFGLAALGSLSRSMEDDISLAMMLRLRGNAIACDRSAEHNRRALRESRARVVAVAAAKVAPLPDAGCDLAELNASVALALERTGQAPPPKQANPGVSSAPSVVVATEPVTASCPPVVAPASPVGVSAPAIAPVVSVERQNQLVWAAGMARMAADYAADLPNLPPAERRETSMWASALSSCAQELSAGIVAPRPRPGDLAMIPGQPTTKS